MLFCFFFKYFKRLFETHSINLFLCEYFGIVNTFSDEILFDVTFCERSFATYPSGCSVNMENRVTQATRLTVHCYLFTDDRRKFIFMRTFNEIT